jgi:hypothetical protein
VPYQWIPQIPKPEETAIAPIDSSHLRVPGASNGEGTGKVTKVAGVDPNRRTIVGMADGESAKSENIDFCVVKFKPKTIGELK